MKDNLKMIPALLCLIFIGWGITKLITKIIHRVKIDQTIEDDSVCGATVEVRTAVHTYTWYGWPNTCEYIHWITVTEDKVDSTSKAEYFKAVPIYLQAKECLSN